MQWRPGTILQLMCCCLSAQLWAEQAQASNVPQLSLAQLVARSDATVLGHSLQTRSFWQGTRILTASTVAVDELWSGTLAGANVIEVVSLGGVVGDLGQRVDGAAELPTYGRMVLHLRQADSEYTPTGMAAGVWQVDGLWGDNSPVRRQVPQHGSSEPFAPHLFASKQAPTVGSLRQAVAQLAAAARPR